MPAPRLQIHRSFGSAESQGRRASRRDSHPDSAAAQTAGKEEKASGSPREGSGDMRPEERKRPAPQTVQKASRDRNIEIM